MFYSDDCLALDWIIYLHYSLKKKWFNLVQYYKDPTLKPPKVHPVNTVLRQIAHILSTSVSVDEDE